MIIKSVRSSLEKCLGSAVNLKHTQCYFSSDTLNFRVPIRDSRTGKLTD